MQVLDSYGTRSRKCHRSGGGWASVVQQVRGEADWRTLDAAFAANRDPLTGHPPSHEYEQFFSRIVRTAPAPIGLREELGPGPRLEAVTRFGGR